MPLTLPPILITPTLFRGDYAEFANTTTWPDTQVQFWLDVAYSLMNACRWGQQLNIGVELFVAHNLVLEAQAAASVAAGGVPGVNSGPLNSKSVGPVSAGYDSSAGLNQGAGFYNLTTYGTRFWWMMRMFGAGPVTTGVGPVPAGSISPWPWL